MSSRSIYIRQVVDDPIAELIDYLSQNGFQSAVSFDLQQVRAEQDTWRCPYHGSAYCDCRYVVLMVSPSNDRGLLHTVTLHNRDGRTWLNLLKNPSLTDCGLWDSIQNFAALPATTTSDQTTADFSAFETRGD